MGGSSRAVRGTGLGGSLAWDVRGGGLWERSSRGAGRPVAGAFPGSLAGVVKHLSFQQGPVPACGVEERGAGMACGGGGLGNTRGGRGTVCQLEELYFGRGVMCFPDLSACLVLGISCF